MTLDEQINLMEELLNDDDHWSCENAKTEYRQLQEWLKDYKRLLEMPKGDLISREALKKAICIDEPISIDETWEQLYDAVVKAIDNAPTVTDRTEEVLSLQNTIAKLVEGIAETARPQGFWAEFEGGYRCSNCDDIEAYTPNFCPNCGADMRRGSAE